MDILIVHHPSLNKINFFWIYPNIYTSTSMYFISCYDNIIQKELASILTTISRNLKSLYHILSRIPTHHFVLLLTSDCTSTASIMVVVPECTSTASILVLVPECPFVR